MSTQPIVPEVMQQQEIENEGGLIVSQLRAIQVVDQESHDLAAEVLTKRAAWKKKVVEFFAPMKKRAYDSWKEICSKETLVLNGEEGVNDRAEVETRINLATWERQMDDLRRQEDARLAKEQAEKDDAARKLAAEHAKSLGAGEEAVQQIMAAPLPVSPPKAAPTYRKSSGVSTRQVWKWRFASTPQAALSALVKAAAKNPSLLGLLQINEKALNGKAETEKSAASVPGIVFYPTTSTTVKAAK